MITFYILSSIFCLIALFLHLKRKQSIIKNHKIKIKSCYEVTTIEILRYFVTSLIPLINFLVFIFTILIFAFANDAKYIERMKHKIEK